MYIQYNTQHVATTVYSTSVCCGDTGHLFHHQCLLLIKIVNRNNCCFVNFVEVVLGTWCISRDPRSGADTDD